MKLLISVAAYGFSSTPGVFRLTLGGPPHKLHLAPYKRNSRGAS